MKFLLTAALLIFILPRISLFTDQKTIESTSPSVTAILHNPSAVHIVDGLLVLEETELGEELGEALQRGKMLVVKPSEVIVAYQNNDMDGDGQTDALALLVNMEPGQKTAVQVYVTDQVEHNFEKRTQAELSIKKGGKWDENKYKGGDFVNIINLRVPEEHTDHSYFIRYEGPGWESDLVGYRFYLDWRNATDIFGKKNPGLVLHKVGLDGFDSYHEMQDWGMDILKVGSSLGIGSLGYWDGKTAQRVSETDDLYCEVVLNGPVQSMVRTKYTGWKIDGNKVDVRSELSIGAGSRMTKHAVRLSAPMPNLCTGIVKHENARMLKKETAGGWCYLATWGKQSLADDDLGMAVLFRTDQKVSYETDAHSHIVVLDPVGNTLVYYFLAAWSSEKNGINTFEAFENYLNKKIEYLNHPVQATLLSD